MSNQNSDTGHWGTESPDSINSSSIGGKKPPVEKKELADTMLEEYQNQQMKQRVEHPSHYTWLKDLCGIEAIDITRHMDFDLGNATKYILRQGRKSEEGISDKEKAIEDLRKAIFYINDKIEMIKKGQ